MSTPVPLPSVSRGAVRETLLLLLFLALCPLAALLIGDTAAGPIARAHALVGAEQALGIHVEPAVHAWARDRPLLFDAAGVFYLGAHVPVAAWALIWTWCLRPDRYRVVRDAFLLTQAGLIAAYVLLPTAPPRLLPGAGFTDPLTAQWGAGLAESAHLLQSPYAAMPSGHVAFALLAGVTFARLGDMAWLRVFGWLYPPLVVAVTVLTRHHLLLDGAGALALVGAAGTLALRWEIRGSPRAGGSRREPVHSANARDPACGFAGPIRLG